MSKKLYVGNLPFSISEDQLREKFEQYGQVRSARVITDRDTGKSKGFGFVEMEEGNDADNAINALNGAELGGRSIAVNEARPREDGPRGGGRGGDRGPRRTGGAPSRFSRDNRGSMV